MWCIPPTTSADFVYHMEDVLDVYHRPSDPLAGWREVTVTDHRCRTNWAHFVKELLDGPAVLNSTETESR